MSEVRLVRCPKCDKVLPEPPGIPVYKCGGCGALLRAKKKSSVSDGLVDGSVGGSVSGSVVGEERLVNSGGSDFGEGPLGNEGSMNMDRRSPIRSMFGDGNGDGDETKPPFWDTEFQGGLPKSPMRERFLDDLGKTPMVSRDASRSPIRERGGSDDFDDDGVNFQGRLGNVSESPMTGTGGTPTSMGASDVRSPMRGRGGSEDFDHDGIDFPARSRNASKSPMTGPGRTPMGMGASDVNRSPMRGRDGSDDFDHDRIDFLARSRNASKSPMMGPGRTPMGMRASDVSRSPMREMRGGSTDFDHDGVNFPARSRNVSKSPSKGRGSTPMSVRRRDGRRSPMMEGGSLGDLDSVGGSQTRSMNGDVLKSPLREGNSEDERVGKMRAKASFSSWLPNGQHEGQSQSQSQSGDDYPGRRRSIWRDQNHQGLKPLFINEHGPSSEGLRDDPTHGNGRTKGGGAYQDRRFKSYYSEGYVRSNVVDGPSNYHADPVYGYGGPMKSFESTRGQELQRAELLRKFNDLKEQLNGLDDAEMSSVDGSSRLRDRPTQFSHGTYNNHPMYAADQYVGQMKMGPPGRSNQYFPNRIAPEYVPERAMNFDQDPRYSNVYDTHARHGERRDGHMGHGYMDHKGYGPRSYDPRFAHLSPQPPLSHPMHHHKKKVEVANLNKRLCRPISGGAPFVLCVNCFELLKLPGNRRVKDRSQRLQCGACSTVASFNLQPKSLDPSAPQKKQDSVLVVDDSGLKPHRDSLTATSTNIGSYDFDAGGYNNLQSMASDASSTVKGNKSNNPRLAEMISEYDSSKPRVSVDERVSDTASVRSSQRNSSEIERPKSIDKETVSEGPVDSTDRTDATETDVHYSDLPSTGVSKDSGDIPRESPVSGTDNVAQSHIDALVKGIDAISVQASSRKVDVYVNGQAIPYRLVRTAEKLAGPIQPGEYWYDPKAGFWGVMDYQCIGIIPPYIQEFSYPMPENCSRGDSNVFVNGRELQESDLELLGRRGLPTTRGMRYEIDISGRTVDEQTKDFVTNLGRLAPSVERNKCGFGMRVPKQLDY